MNTQEIILPMQYSKHQIRRVTYNRVSKQLDKDKLLAIWKAANAKEIPQILEDKYQICFQYPKKPILIIRKKDGKLAKLKGLWWSFLGVLVSAWFSFSC